MHELIKCTKRKQKANFCILGGIKQASTKRICHVSMILHLGRSYRPDRHVWL